MKEICKNCIHCKPTYKGGRCEITDKKVVMNKGLAISGEQRESEA